MSKEAELDSDYVTVMQSIARRLLASRSALSLIHKTPNSIDKWIHMDFVTLQIRKVCELYLLGSTLAHHETGSTGIDLEKWRPKDVFKQIDKFDNHPLPIPLGPHLQFGSLGTEQFQPVSKPLPFSVLVGIYGQCSDLLHAPNAKKLLNEKIQPFNWNVFHRWTHGFSRMLENHLLILPNLNKVFWCNWSGTAVAAPNIILFEMDGKVQSDIDTLPEFDLLRI